MHDTDTTDNALVEISLALAMAFFALLVVALVSIAAPAQQDVEAVERPRAAVEEIGLTADLGEAPRSEGSTPRFLLHHRGRWFDIEGVVVHPARARRRPTPAGGGALSRADTRRGAGGAEGSAPPRHDPNPDDPQPRVDQETGGKPMKTLKRTLAMFAGGMLAFAAVDSDARLATTLPRATMIAMVAEEAAAQGVPADLALAVAEAESGFATLAISSKGARGVMQMMPRTARDLYGLKPYQLFDARTNIRAGVAFLGSLIERYGREDIALSHYNGGSSVHRADGGYAVIPATCRYVHRVLSRRRHYASVDTGGHDSLRMDGVSSPAWRVAASRELAALDKERRRTVDALRVLVAENTRRSARLPGAVASKANARGRAPAIILLSADQ